MGYLKKVHIFTALLALACSFGAAGLTLPPITPALEPLPVIDGDPESLTSWSYIAQDDMGRVCFAAKHRGLHCYDGADLKQVYDGVARGLTAITDAAGHKTLHFFSGRKAMVLRNGKVNERVFGDFLQEDGEKVHGTAPDGKNNYFIISSHALYSSQEDSIVRVEGYKDKAAIMYARRLADGSVQVATVAGLFLISPQGATLSHTFKGHSVYYMKDGYILTSKGVYYGDESRQISDKSFFRMVRRKSGATLLAGEDGMCSLVEQQVKCGKPLDFTVYNLYEDDFGNLFASTLVGAMYAKNSPVNYLTTTEGLLSDNVAYVESTNDSVFIGTSKGVNRLDVNTGKIDVLSGTEGLTVNALLYHNNKLWVGVTTGGLFYYDFETGRTYEIANIKGRMTGMALFDDSIWVATRFSGVYKIDENGQILLKNSQPIINRVKKIQTCNDRLFVATIFDGLVTLDRHGNITGVIHNSNKHEVFSCKGDNIVLSAGSTMAFIGSTFKVASETILPSDITSLIHHDNAVYAILEDRVQEWQQGSKTDEWKVGSISLLYNNRIDSHGSFLLSGSLKGLAVIDLEYLKSRSQALPGITLSTFNAGNGLTVIEPRLTDVAALRDFGMYYKMPHFDGYRRLRWGENVVIDEQDVGPLSFFAQGLDGEKTVVSTLDTQKAGSPHQSEGFGAYELPYHYRYLFGFMVTLLVALSLAVLYYRQAKSRSSARVLADQDGSPDKVELLDDFEMFSQKLQRIEQGLEGNGTSVKRVLAFNELILREGYDDGLIKVLAAKIGETDQSLRAAIRALFHSGRIKQYAAMFLRYKEEGHTREGMVNQS